MRTEADMGNGISRSIVGKSERESLRLVRSEILSEKSTPGQTGIVKVTLMDNAFGKSAYRS